jgi:hypothetical protein
MVSVLGRFFVLGRGSEWVPLVPLEPLLVGAVPFNCAGGVRSLDISRSVPDDCDMLRGRFRKGLLRPLELPENKPFGDSRRWGDVRADLRTKLPASGRVDRLRQKESRGNWPLVVAADTGLTSGEGVMAVMIGGRRGRGSERSGVQPRNRCNGCARGKRGCVVIVVSRVVLGRGVAWHGADTVDRVCM